MTTSLVACEHLPHTPPRRALREAPGRSILSIWRTSALPERTPRLPVRTMGLTEPAGVGVHGMQRRLAPTDMGMVQQ